VTRCGSLEVVESTEGRSSALFKKGRGGGGWKKIVVPVGGRGGGGGGGGGESRLGSSAM